MTFVRLVLKHPHTVAALLILVSLLGVGAALRMPLDIFPEIDIPVVSVVWTYNGMSAADMQNRILSLHERQMASLVDDISRIEAASYEGVGVEKVFLHEGADVSRAVSQLEGSALAVLKSLPPNTTPPLVLRYGATDVPIIQLSLSSRTLTDTRLNDLGQNIIRPALAVVHGAEVPQPYGGKPRVIMADLDSEALSARGLSPADVSDALQRQNVILPAGDVKIGSTDYALAMNNSTDVIDGINAFPVAVVAGRSIFMRDIAHVHDGFQVQTNSVSVDGQPGALITIRKTGGVSALAVIDGVRAALTGIRRQMPRGVLIKPIFDQSIFVNAALSSVEVGALLAAVLTAVMILLFLGNWRLTLIILAAIPLSIIAAMLILHLDGQTLNTMTLGGLALAVGILVDNGTVVIENIERHLGLGRALEEAIVHGASEVAIPTTLATVSICVVFVPVFLLQGTARYLFSPLSVAVCASLLASLALSFTMVPLLFRLLMRSYLHATPAGVSALARVHLAFNRHFDALRAKCRDALAFMVAEPLKPVLFFVVLLLGSLALFPMLGRDFFPRVDAGQMRLHVRAPAGTRLEQTQDDFAQVEAAIRNIVGAPQIDTVLDNIGLPYSGINIALSDSATVGPMDGEVLISLGKRHTPTTALIAQLRRELPRRFPQLQFFFQPADIVDQILNFGEPAPIDIRISGSDGEAAYQLAGKLVHDLGGVPGVRDAHVFQVPDAPTLDVNVDRTLANGMGLAQRSVADDVLITTNGSAQSAPNFWIDPHNDVSYPLVVQMPAYRIESTHDLWTLPLTAGAADRKSQILVNVAGFHRSTTPMVLSQLNIRPVFDVDADVEDRDLNSAAADIDRVIDADRPDASRGLSVTLGGQIETMRESYSGLFSGMAVAVVLVYLFLVINFQSWIDPLIVLAAVPFALAGGQWMLFLTGTPLSVPALMGTLMCIGLTTANSILVVTFANQRMAAGDSVTTAAVTASYTRMRPVLMTAGAMVLGMTPMALGIGEGGEQNAPLARAVIGGLLFATFATLMWVPIVYRSLRRPPRPAEAVLKGELAPIP